MLGQPPVLNGTHWFLKVTAVVVTVVLFVVAVGVGFVVDGLVVVGVVGGLSPSRPVYNAQTIRQCKGCKIPHL